MGNIYFGEYSRTLDDKGRLQIPSRLNRSNEKIFYMLRGFDGCISIYPEESFLKYIARLESLDYEDAQNRAKIRILLSSTNELSVDAHGRISLSKAILKDYSINKEVTIIGVLDHFEIWDTLALSNYKLSNRAFTEFMKGN
ncbi:MAG: division/cell wall cluster transcriptional repressor MraZ [Bacilli bacterium]|nr:division/cell wall cluster transcriptional repressor MraZ [Bacilli bacterium]MDY6430573.1 division/cell wall cluster transcriptional repressor MraZ [Bacilli bacterium]